MTTESDWIAHDGGPNPVRVGETLVAFKRRDGHVAGRKQCSADGSVYHWGRSAIEPDYDITHYRVTPLRASMSAEEVLVRAREAAIEACDMGGAEATATRSAKHDKYGVIRAILAFHRDLSRPLAEVAPHTVDADERAAWEIYRTNGGGFVWGERHDSKHWRTALAAYRAGKAAR